MSLNVSLGPLPQEGIKVDASQFLEAYVQGCDFTNLNDDNFEAAGFGMVSQTDAPASIGNYNLWFQRGTGRLWINQLAGFGGSPYSARAYVGISPVRELLVWSNWKHKGTCQRPYWPGDSAGLLGAGVYDTFFGKPLEMSETKLSLGTYVQTECFSCWVAADTSTSDRNTRVVEYGFVDVALSTAGTTYTVAKGQFFTTFIVGDNNRGYFECATALGTLATGRFFADVVVQSATRDANAATFVKVYHRPAITWGNFWSL